MPELPEVETVVQSLVALPLISETIAAIEIQSGHVFEGDLALLQEIQNQVITACFRRGKYIVIELANHLYVIIHFRMTGKILIQRGISSISKHQHATIELKNGKKLVFIDPRKFGRIYCTNNLEEFFHHLGIEPLEMTLQAFTDCIQHKKQKVKAFLLDQSNIAGLGNIYADEALFQARIHPERNVHVLTVPEKLRLFKAILSVLTTGIKARGSSLGKHQGNFVDIEGKFGHHGPKLQVYGKKGMPCPCCTNPIQRIRISQRSTHFCQNCQVLN